MWEKCLATITTTKKERIKEIPTLRIPKCSTGSADDDIEFEAGCHCGVQPGSCWQVAGVGLRVCGECPREEVSPIGRGSQLPEKWTQGHVQKKPPWWECQNDRSGQTKAAFGAQKSVAFGAVDEWQLEIIVERLKWKNFRLLGRAWSEGERTSIGDTLTGVKPVRSSCLVIFVPHTGSQMKRLSSYSLSINLRSQISG